MSTFKRDTPLSSRLGHALGHSPLDAIGIDTSEHPLDKFMHGKVHSIDTDTDDTSKSIEVATTMSEPCDTSKGCGCGVESTSYETPSTPNEEIPEESTNKLEALHKLIAAAGNLAHPMTVNEHIRLQLDLEVTAYNLANESPGYSRLENAEMIARYLRRRIGLLEQTIIK